eukprot:tig00000455_g1013.t1
MHRAAFRTEEMAAAAAAAAAAASADDSINKALQVPSNAFRLTPDMDRGKRSMEREIGTGLKDKLKEEQDRFNEMKREIGAEHERRKSVDAQRTSLDRTRKSLERVTRAQSALDGDLEGEGYIYDPAFHMGGLQNFARHWTQAKQLRCDKDGLYDVTGGKRELLFMLHDVYEIKNKSYPRHAFCFAVKIHHPHGVTTKGANKYAFGFDEKPFHDHLMERIIAKKRSASSH